MVEQITTSTPQTLYCRVRELARSSNRLVDDILVELLDQALPPDESGEVDDEETAVKREMQAYITFTPHAQRKIYRSTCCHLWGKIN